MDVQNSTSLVTSVGCLHGAPNSIHVCKWTLSVCLFCVGDVMVS